MSAAFRERHRNYGVLIPVHDVEAHLACGWALADDWAELAASAWPRDEVLLRPPRLAGAVVMMEAAE